VILGEANQTLWYTTIAAYSFLPWAVRLGIYIARDQDTTVRIRGSIASVPDYRRAHRWRHSHETVLRGSTLWSW
jgi:hypothetical protein